MSTTACGIGSPSGLRMRKERRYGTDATYKSLDIRVAKQSIIDSRLTFQMINRGYDCLPVLDLSTGRIQDVVRTYMKQSKTKGSVPQPLVENKLDTAYPPYLPQYFVCP